MLGSDCGMMLFMNVKLGLCLLHVELDRLG